MPQKVEPMISVIVPIYNVEPYLRRALDSIISQTYKEWEAILVDDGSTDGCGKIADEYARKDNRFRVIHKPNGGLSDARNAGMRQIQGEYILFLDADDFLHPQLMSLCMEATLRDGSDIVCFTYDHSYRLLGRIRNFLHLGEPTPHYKYYRHPNYLVTDNLFAYSTEYSHPKDIDRRWAVKHCRVWRCLYKTYAVRDIPFVKGINYEDFPWWSEVLLRIQRATILNLPLYFYYPNPKSYVISTNQQHKVRDMEAAIEAAKKVYENVTGEKKRLWEERFLAPFQHLLAKKRKKLAKGDNR
ncbi:MAG: glycosyltransferase family 2 protein [Bacteroidaceae bacterium]|nr:glycosyltransferase family 2 protein [Bacteroidaceae bacterium]